MVYMNGGLVKRERAKKESQMWKVKGLLSPVGGGLCFEFSSLFI